MSRALSLIAFLALLSSACTSTGNVERNAAGGAAAGAIAGAIIGNNTGSGDAGSGAAVGAAAGGVAGAVRGYSLDQRQAECRNSPRSETFRDSSGRPYYFVLGTDRTCWSATQTPRGL